MSIGKKRTLREKWRLTSLPNKVITLATVVIAGAGVLTFGAALFQWLEMRGAGQQTDRIIAADERLATAMENSVKEAGKSLDASIEQFHREQRAWVGIGGITAHPESFHVGDHAFVNISFKNTGKTPAKNILITVVKDPVPRGIPPRFSYEGEKVARYGLLPPNGDNFASLSIANSISTKEARPLTAQVLDTLVSGGTIVYIHGQLSYQDIFNRDHWTTFCYFLLNPQDVVTFGACPEHNDTGDGEIPKYQPPKVPSAWPSPN